MKYILKVSPKAFIINQENEMIITPDYIKATQYSTIGEAMRIASEINKILETSIVKVVSLS